MTNDMKQSEVNNAIWRACDTFRGTASPSVYKDFILTIYFLRYISNVQQEKEEEFTAKYGDTQELITEMLKTQPYIIPEVCSFWTLYKSRHEAGNGERIDNALQCLEQTNKKFKGMFQDITFNTDKLGNEKQKNDTLDHLLTIFGGNIFKFPPQQTELAGVAGNTYEYLINNFALSSGKGGEESYTQPEMSDLLSMLVTPQEGDTIYDPACGSGSLLLKCAKQVQENFNGSKKYTLYGQEVASSTWSLAKMNMFLHGEEAHHIEWGDTIRNPKLLDSSGKLLLFDVVISNPPFGLAKWGDEIAVNDPFERFTRGIPPKSKGDYAFISHMIESLKPNSGRMAVVMPHGVLFRASSEKQIRQRLIEENLLDTVIGLPEKLYFSTGIPSVILIFRKQKDDDKVLFIDASYEFQSSKHQNQLTSENIQKIINTFQERKSVEKYAYLSSLEEIQENDYNLNIPRYVDTFEVAAEHDLIALKTERLELQNELMTLENQMAGNLEKWGY